MKSPVWGANGGGDPRGVEQRHKGASGGKWNFEVTQGNKEESFHWARNLRREPGKRANKLDNQERGLRTGLSSERVEEKLCQ